MSEHKRLRGHEHRTLRACGESEVEDVQREVGTSGLNMLPTAIDDERMTYSDMTAWPSALVKKACNKKHIPVREWRSWVRMERSFSFFDDGH